MAEEEKDKRYYWLRLKRDFFKRHDIQIIESQPNGKDYVLFYLKLLVESVDHNGNLRFSDTIPYNEQMLATITNTNIDIVRAAMKVFTELKMIDVLSDHTIYMADIEKMTGSETYWAERKRIQKSRKELSMNFENITPISAEALILPNGKTQYIDNKRYGGNALYVFERAKGVCEVCGSEDNLCIHHKNGFSNDINDLIVVCRTCHRNYEIGKIPIDVQKMSNECPTCPSKSKSKSNIKDIGQKADQTSELFNKFWSSYPRHVSKASAEKAFNKLKVTEEILDKMLRSLETQKQSRQWSDKQYIPHPATWLNQKRWEDEADEPQTGAKLIQTGDNSFKLE